MEIQRGRSKKHMAICVLYLAVSAFYPVICGCGSATSPQEKISPTDSRGYVLYVFAKGTEVMIDLRKSDGISRGTKLDVFRMNVPNMNEPVKLGEITTEKVGGKMSKAKVTLITSSLRMEQGDRVFPHLITIVSDDSWFVSRKQMDGWKSDPSLSHEWDWEPCKLLPGKNMEPELRQLAVETNLKPVWHPSVKSQRGDVFFRRVFRIDAELMTAELSVACGGRTNVYLNGRWVAEAEEWPKISSFKVHTFLNRGRNLIAVHAVRDPRINTPPVLFLALTVQTKFQ